MEEIQIKKNHKNPPFIDDYLLNNTKYNIKIDVEEDFLLIDVTIKSKIDKFIYSFKKSKEFMGKLDKYFLLFENIEEIKNNIIEILKAKDLEIKIEKDNRLKLIIKHTINSKQKNIEFLLIKKELKKDNLIDLLIDKINYLEKENQYLKNKFKEFENLFSEEMKEKLIIKEEKKKLEKNYKDCLIGDSISTIEKCEEYKLIEEGIYRQFPNIKNKKIILELIFKSSRDGYTPQDFHRHCDNVGPTVCIVKTSKNIKFGGFLSISWKTKGGIVCDKNSFLFNLNFNKIYPSNGIGGPYFKDINGPDFVFGISIWDDYRKFFHHVSEAKSMIRNWKNVDLNYDYELNNGEYNFNIKEIEVFRVFCQ